MPGPLRLLRGLWNRVSASWWTRRGKSHLTRGDARGAVAAFECALRRRPDAFGALLHLSRAYLRQRDLFRAHRTLARAREAHPSRFLAEAAPWIAREGYLVEEITEPRPQVRHPEPAATRAAQRTRGRALTYGDCRDLDEYARFQAMPPISRAEVEGLDWDAVLGDLQDD